MKDLAIFGAGGLGKEIACMIRNRLPEWNIIGFFDDGKPKGQRVLSLGLVHGGVDDLNAWPNNIAIAIAIGNPQTVKTIVEKINNPKISFPNIIHPNFEKLDSDTFAIGRGNIIMGGCRVSCNVSMGDFNLLNGAVIIGHDSKIGSYNSIMPAVRISGGVKIGDYNFLGISSIVLQQVKIGHGVKLGAGSVLMTIPQNGHLYMGNPARKTEF